MKKKALLISPVYPDHTGDGRQKRAHQWVTALAVHYDISLLIVRPGSPDRLAEPDRMRWSLPESIVDVETVFGSSSRAAKAADLIGCLLAMTVNRTRSSVMIGAFPLKAAAKSLLTAKYEGRRYDYVLCFRLYLHEYALFLHRLLKPALLELDMDDIESTTRGSIASLLRAGGYRKQAFLTRLSSRCFRLLEQRVHPSFTKLYVCSQDDDREYGSRLGTGRHISIMPNRLYRRPVPAELPGNTRQLLFVGNLDYYPNEEAIFWFVKRVLPDLRASDRRWTFHIAGLGGSRELVQLLGQTDGVRFHGRVDSLQSVYAQAYMIVIPLHAGGGTKLKTLEAIWHSRPIVATAESVRGLELQPSVHYRAAESAAEFVQACRELAECPGDAKRYAEAAMDVLMDHYIYGGGGNEY